MNSKHSFSFRATTKKNPCPHMALLISLSWQSFVSLFLSPAWHYGREQPKNTDCSTRLLIRSHVHLHRSLVCSLWTPRFARALHCAHSFTHFAHSFARGKVNYHKRLFCLCFFSIFDHSAWGRTMSLSPIFGGKTNC